MTNQQYIEAARDQYQHEGEVEVDDGAIVSRGSDHGAYVLAWVWVDDPSGKRNGSEDDPDATESEYRLVQSVSKATGGPMSNNRIRIFNWREIGDDESYAKVCVLAADADDDIEAIVRAEYDIPTPAHEEEGEDGTIFVNDDITIFDGEVIESPDGRKFTISITETPK